MASDEQASKRRRVKTTRYNFDYMENDEQKLLQQALKISKRDVKREELDIPDAPVYYPTAQEFHDPIGYVRKIRLEAEHYGICKIVPPEGWKFDSKVNMESTFRFPTKVQRIDTLQQGQGYDDGKEYNMREFKSMADKFFNDWMEKHHNGKTITDELLTKDYWRLVETSVEAVEVEYGNDLDTNNYMSGFPRARQETNHYKKEQCVNMSDPTYYEESGWNTNNIARAKGSVLQFLEAQINGVNVPWLYIGMLFSTFCWHNEDNYLYSINYNHFGSGKQWYGIPGAEASVFEKVSKDFLSGLFEESPDLLHHMTTQISPFLLAKNGVPIYKMTQEEGTFIITFPKSFHAGFSLGFNVGEAVNFASIDWLPFGREAEDRYRIFGREPIFSHTRLLFTLLQNKETLQMESRKLVAKEVIRVVNDELGFRDAIIHHGVRDLSMALSLPPNDFSRVTEKSIEYDDMRCCCICKQVCTFTAVGCDCSRVNVGCTRHYTFMCKCPPQKKFLLVWAQPDALNSLKDDARTVG